MTIWVWVTIAASLPSFRLMRVCTTMVERPRCSGTASARATSQCAAMHHAAAVLEFLAHRKLRLDPVGRDADELDAKEACEGRLVGQGHG